MNIYVAILLGLVFTVVYSAVNTFLYNMNYKRMNNGRSMDKKMIKINLLMNGVIALIMVGVAIYLSYFK